MKTKAWEVTDFASVYKVLGLNLTSVLALRYYCEKHPMKTDVLMNKVPAIFTVDPILSRMKESKSLEAMFKKLSVYSFFLASTDKQHYAFIGKYQNDTMLNVSIDKQYKGRYVNMTLACVFAARDILAQVREENKKRLQRLDLNLSTEEDIVETPVYANEGSPDDHLVQDIPIVANEVIAESAPTQSTQSIPPEMMQQFNMPRSNMTFKDLPLDLQKTIERDFEILQKSEDPL